MYVIMSFVFLGILLMVAGHYRSKIKYVYAQPNVIYKFVDRTDTETYNSKQESTYNKFAAMFVDKPIGFV